MPLDRRAFILDPQWQPQEAFLRRLFRPAAALTILDAGACEGESAVRYARLFPHARVVAVEPLPGNVARIRANIAEFATPNVVVAEACLSDRAGEATFHVSSGVPDEYRDQSLDWDFGNKSSSLLAPEQTKTVHPWLEFPATITVATERLDALAAALGITHVDFLHLDVQGAELLVLDGAGALLPRIHTLWLEVENVPLYRGQPLKAQVETYLRARGFVKLYDSVDQVSGDQFWAQERWLTRYWGGAWVLRARCLWSISHGCQTGTPVYPDPALWRHLRCGDRRPNRPYLREVEGMVPRHGDIRVCSDHTDAGGEPAGTGDRRVGWLPRSKTCPFRHTGFPDDRVLPYPDHHHRNHHPLPMAVEVKDWPCIGSNP